MNSPSTFKDIFDENPEGLPIEEDAFPSAEELEDSEAAQQWADNLSSDEAKDLAKFLQQNYQFESEE